MLPLRSIAGYLVAYGCGIALLAFIAAASGYDSALFLGLLPLMMGLAAFILALVDLRQRKPTADPAQFSLLFGSALISAVGGLLLVLLHAMP